MNQLGSDENSLIQLNLQKKAQLDFQELVDCKSDVLKRARNRFPAKLNQGHQAVFLDGSHTS